MLTERSSSQPGAVESANTNLTADHLLKSLKTSGEYRHSFVEEVIRTRITAQIHALRTKNGWDYKVFAEKLGKKLSWAYRLEDPNDSPPTIPSLLEVAAVCDVYLDIRFRPFSSLIRDMRDLSDASFAVPSFTEELPTLEREIEDGAQQARNNTAPQLQDQATNTYFDALLMRRNSAAPPMQVIDLYVGRSDTQSSTPSGEMQRMEALQNKYNVVQIDSAPSFRPGQIICKKMSVAYLPTKGDAPEYATGV